MNRVLVLGGGQMGSIVAQELAKNYHVDVADVNSFNGNIVFDAQNADLEDYTELYKGYDLVVCALPSKFGYLPVRAAAHYGYNCVDLSFNNHDLSKLHKTAKKNNSIVLHDCGLSPGLSNLFVGKLARDCGKDFDGAIWVGGISKDPDAPYGHVNTWCTEDLLEEYIRPARIIVNNREEIVNPLHEDYWSGLQTPLGYLEAFISDGLRSLLKLRVLNKKNQPSLIEYTLRRPGHLKKIKPLVENRTFVETIKKECSQGDDVVYLQVSVNEQSVVMIDEASDGLSSMARTTAFSCAAFCELVLRKVWTKPGVFPPEEIGLSSEDCCKYMVNKLKSHNIKIVETPKCRKVAVGIF